MKHGTCEEMMGKYYFSDIIYHIDFVLKRNVSNILPICIFLIFLQSEFTRYDVNGLQYEANLAKLMFERSVRV